MEWNGVVIVLLAACGIACIVGLVMARERQRSQAREQRASERSWRYSRGGGRGVLYRVEGTEGGVPWTLTSLQSGQNKHGHAIWTIPEPPLPGGAVVVGSKAMAAFLKSPVGSTLTRWGLRLGVPGKDVSEAWGRLAEGCEVVEAGHPEFDASYAVLTTDPGSARRLVRGEACQAILDWENAHKIGAIQKGKLTLAWSGAGLQVTWNGTSLPSPDDMVAFVELGLRLRGPCKSGW